MIELNVRTARYGNPKIAGSGFIPVGITVGAPRFRLGYELRANLYDLAPTGRIFGLKDKDEFAAAYREKLDGLGATRIRELLEAIQNGDFGIVLLCYEDVTAGDWCHRQILAAWLTEHGIPTEELEDPGKQAKVSPQSGLFT